MPATWIDGAACGLMQKIWVCISVLWEGNKERMRDCVNVRAFEKLKANYASISCNCKNPTDHIRKELWNCNCLQQIYHRAFCEPAASQDSNTLQHKKL